MSKKKKKLLTDFDKKWNTLWGETPVEPIIAPKNIDEPVVLDAEVSIVKTILRKEGEEYYDIYRRIPALNKNVRIFMGLTKQQAVTMIEHTLKPKIKDEVLTFYDMVPEDASEEERALYYNPPETRTIKGEK